MAELIADPTVITAIVGAVVALITFYLGHKHVLIAPPEQAPPPGNPAAPAPPAQTTPVHPILDMFLGKVDSRLRTVIETAADVVLNQVWQQIQTGGLPPPTPPAAH